MIYAVFPLFEMTRTKRLLLFFSTLLFAPLLALGAEAKPDPIRCELAVIGGGSGGFGAALAAASVRRWRRLGSAWMWCSWSAATGSVAIPCAAA